MGSQHLHGARPPQRENPDWIASLRWRCPYRQARPRRRGHNSLQTTTLLEHPRPACGVRRPRERHVAATRLTVLAEQGFPATPELYTRTRALPRKQNVAERPIFLYFLRERLWPRAPGQLRASGLAEAIVSIRAAYLKEVAGLLERYPNWSSANRRCSLVCSFAQECLFRADRTAAGRDCRLLRGRSR